MLIDAKQEHLNLYTSDPEYREEYDRLEAEFQEIREALKMRDSDDIKSVGDVRDIDKIKPNPRVRDVSFVKTEGKLRDTVRVKT